MGNLSHGMSDLDDLMARVAALEEIVLRLPINQDRIYTPAQVADWLQCSTTNVYRLIDSGELAYTRIGASKKGFKIKGSDLLAFLESRKVGGPKPRMAFKRLGL